MKTKYLLMLTLIYMSINLRSQISGPYEIDLNTTATFTNTNGACGSGCIMYYWAASGSTITTYHSETQFQVKWTEDGIEEVELWFIDFQGVEHLLASHDIKAGDPVKVQFSYDAAGNRIGRETVYLTMGGTKSLANPDAPEPEPEIEINNEIKVYPNPVREVLFLALNEEAMECENKYVELYDNLGRLRKKIILNDYVNEIPANDLSSGTYILKLYYDNKYKEWLIVK